jgi:hypothetical protein
VTNAGQFDGLLGILTALVVAQNLGHRLDQRGDLLRRLADQSQRDAEQHGEEQSASIDVVGMMLIVIGAWEHEVDLPTAQRVLDGDVQVDVTAG